MSRLSPPPFRTASRRWRRGLQEIEASVADGADEIDVVIPRGLVYGREVAEELYDEIAARCARPAARRTSR
jgi:deoxyribose-phosphate aldolase